MNKVNIQKIISDHIESEREEKDITNWYASGLGSCLTGRYLERMGVEPDEDFDERTLRVFSVGRMFEDWLISKIGAGHKVETQVRVESKEHHISGKVDLILNDVVFEVKSKHSKAFWWMTKQGDAQIQHKMQLWVYLWLLKKEKGRIVYISKDDLAIQEYWVMRDDKELEEMVMNELNILNEAWEQKLPPRPVDDPKHWHNKYCRFHKQCIAQEQYLN